MACAACIAISPLNQAGADPSGPQPIEGYGRHADFFATRLPPIGYRRVHESDANRVFPTKTAALARRTGQGSKRTLASLGEGGILEADITDRASVETDRALELRTRDRARKLIGKIDQALQRIENGSYGYCEETGEPIGLKRLEARPIATLSIEAQERHERMEKVHRDD